MPKIVTVAEMKAIEAAADRQGVTYAMMMDSAGSAVAAAVLARIAEAERHKAVVLCGSGNNGGDGLVAAERLAEAGVDVAVYGVRPFDERDPKAQALLERGLPLPHVQADPDGQTLRALLAGATVLVDAVLGTGARLPVAGAQAEVLRVAGEALAGRADDAPLIVAVDCPSGTDMDSGALDPLALPAQLTVTFAAAKRGQFAFPAAEAHGELVVADIGIDPELPELGSVGLEVVTVEAVQAALPARPRNAHKGTFGRSLVVAGSLNYVGAAYLAGAAAYRVGAGLVTLAVPQPIHAILAAQLPEATWLLLPAGREPGCVSAEGYDVIAAELAKCQSLLVGPGFGQERDTLAFVRRWLSDDARRGRRAGLGFLPADEAGADPSSPEGGEQAARLPPVVVDADGLKLLAQVEGWWQRLPQRSVLTPHPGEMAILTGLSTAEIQARRFEVAQRFATEWGHVVVLKGAFTVVAEPAGRTVVEPFATAALARAGTGDVLAGAIAGLLAQGVPAFEAALAGAFLHGLAGELAAQRMGNPASVIASDVLAGLVEALRELAD